MARNRTLGKGTYVAVCLVLVLSAANFTNAQNRLDVLSIFCNGQTNPEMETRWNVDRNGGPSPAVPGVPKVLEYHYALAEDQKGIYSFRYSSYWTFKAELWKRGLSTEEWRPAGYIASPRAKKDDQNRQFWFFDLDIDAPRVRSSQFFIRVIPDPYDPTFLMVARVYSSRCTKAASTQPPSEATCRWVETMVGQPIANPYCECGGRAVDKSRCGR